MSSEVCIPRLALSEVDLGKKFLIVLVVRSLIGSTSWSGYSLRRLRWYSWLKGGCWTSVLLRVLFFYMIFLSCSAWEPFPSWIIYQLSPISIYNEKVKSWHSSFFLSWLSLRGYQLGFVIRWLNFRSEWLESPHPGWDFGGSGFSLNFSSFFCRKVVMILLHWVSWFGTWFWVGSCWKSSISWSNRCYSRFSHYPTCKFSCYPQNNIRIGTPPGAEVVRHILTCN